MSLKESSPASDADAYEVVIVGGGPVGLISAIQLGRAGIKTLLLERRSSFSVHPKASGIHARTMELYRQLGLADVIRKNSADWNGIFSIGWMTRLSGFELGKISIGETEEEQNLFRSWSPESMAFCSQDLYEPIFAEVIGHYPTVTLRLSSEVTATEQDAEGVSVCYKSQDGDVWVRGQYAIASDGVRSPSRTRLGITESGIESMGDSVNVVFEANLEQHRAGREYGLFWIVNGDTQGAFGYRRRGNLWSYNFEAAEGEDPSIYTPDRCVEIIKLAAGAPDVPIDVISTLHWKHDQAVSDRWRAGRVFLAGDSAHRFPPHGGFGMNSGVQDSQNLVWKLVARLRWGAGDALLSSYEVERKPVAELNGKQMILNTKRMAETGFLTKNSQALAIIEQPEGEELREKIKAGVPKQREQILSQGQQFGRIYTSGAIVDDGRPPVESTISEYKPTGTPGARAPHVWLNLGDEKQISTIDLYNGGFILFAAREGEDWKAAAAHACETAGAPLAAYLIGGADYAQRQGDPLWEDLVGIGPTGAVLVRPDGHVGARWQALPDDPRAELEGALRQILDLDADGK